MDLDGITAIDVHVHAERNQGQQQDDDEAGMGRRRLGAPKCFPEILLRYTNTLLRHKMLLGSDYPLITPDRWLKEFAELPIKEDVRPLVLKQNAIRLLKLDATGNGS